MDTYKIVLLLSTNREGRQSENVAHYVLEALESHPQITPTFFDVKDFRFPEMGYGEDIKDNYPEYRDAIVDCDGMIVVLPEYNHSFPGHMKTLMDTLLSEYIHKPVGFVGVSAGSFGGVRVIEGMLPYVRELGLVATFTDLHFPKVGEAFDDSGKLKDEKTYTKRTAKFLNELLWMAQVLRYGRENIERKK